MFQLKHLPAGIEEKVYRFLFLTICTTLASSLFISVYPRKVFYFISYATIIFMAIKLLQNEFIYNRKSMAISVAFMLIGIIRFTWGEIYSQTQFSDITSNYRTGGKIFIVSSLTAYFFITWRHYITQTLSKKGFVILLSGMVITLGFAMHEHFETGLRVKLLTDSAGTVSYLLTALALSTLFLGYNAIHHTGTRVGVFCTIFSLNIILLTLTESRAGILTLPILYLGFFGLVHPKLIKSTLVPLIILMTIGFVILPQSLWQRLDSINVEMSSYKTNNDTSIGARFSIWKGGYSSIKWSLTGQSPDERTQKAREFIIRHERNNPEAYKNVQYHLHDDILETFSLQGIIGGISILFFYITLLIIPVQNQSVSIALLPASFVIFGLTDTVLIQSDSATVLCLTVFVSYSLLQNKHI
jgi:O-antigen ligase